MSIKRKVLFLCTGNSCRSQMAEAIVNYRMSDHWEAFSAGTKLMDYIHPKALIALTEIGILHEGYSKSADVFRGMDFDLVVTVCDDAAENCPAWLGKGEKALLSFPDPAKASGDEEEVSAFIRQIRDDIVLKIPMLLSKFYQGG